MKTQLIIIGIIFITTFVYSQESKKSYLGVKLGATHSKMIEKPEAITFVESTLKSNIFFGIAYQFKFNSYIGLEAQLNYHNIGTNYIDLQNDGINDMLNVNIKTELKYINLPTKVIVTPFKENYFYLIGGFYFSKLLEAVQIGDVDAYDFGSVTYQVDQELLNNTTQFDFGFTGGMGTRHQITNKIDIGFEVRYNQGVIELNSNKGPDDPSYNNRYFLIQLSVYNLLN